MRKGEEMLEVGCHLGSPNPQYAAREVMQVYRPAGYILVTVDNVVLRDDSEVNEACDAVA